MRSRLFLVGPMGAGKTTVGRELARLRQMTFVDVDHEIERRTGVDIPYIFEKEGEPGFRQRECQLIDELTQLPDTVLATGGGAVMAAQNREHLGARGFVIYLYASVDSQWRRIRRSKHRPLLQTPEPKLRLQQLMEQRDPLYRQIADLIVPSRRQSAATLARYIDQELSTGAGL